MKDVKNLTVQEAIFLETVRGNKEVAFALIDAYACGNAYMEQALKSAISDGDTTFVSGVLFCEPPTSYCYLCFYDAEQKEVFLRHQPSPEVCSGVLEETRADAQGKMSAPGC